MLPLKYFVWQGRGIPETHKVYQRRGEVLRQELQTQTQCQQGRAEAGDVDTGRWQHQSFDVLA